MSTGWSIIHRLTPDIVVKFLSPSYFEHCHIEQPDRATANEQQLMWEHEIAQGLRAAGLPAVETFGVDDVYTRFGPFGIGRQVRLRGLVMRYVQGTPVNHLAGPTRERAQALLEEIAKRAKRTPFYPDPREDLARNALYDKRTDTLTLVDFSFWNYRPSMGNL